MFRGLALWAGTANAQSRDVVTPQIIARDKADTR